MKTIITSAFVLAASICSLSSSAQAPTSYKVDQTTSVAAPQTTINVGIKVVKTSIKTGPYARFAQKFLGVMAPLTDKEIYSIKTATLSYNDLQTNMIYKIIPYSPAVNNSFDMVTPDRMILGMKSPEEMARDAANQIFTLRKRRFDLITGEAGENVFGAGLKSAIREMNELETELLALFIGKETVTTELKTFKIVPVTETQSYFVARFSENGGLLNESDLSGTPIMLSVAIESSTAIHTPKKESKVNDYYHVAAMANCKVVFGTSVLSSERIPILQLGRTVAVAATSSK